MGQLYYIFSDLFGFEDSIVRFARATEEWFDCTVLKYNEIIM